MLPPFNEFGLLPPGVHLADLAQFEERFVRFDHSDRRLKLYVGLQRLLNETRKLPFIKQILIVGSFVTSKPEPNDFDCLLVIDREQFPIELRPFEYRIVSRRSASKEFGGDVITVVDGSELHHRYLKFFQKTRDIQQVGIVEISP